MIRPLAILIAISGATALGLVACDDDEAEGTAEGGDANTAVHLNLLELAHLADVDHDGLFVDFGTPAQDKYTVGNWNSGWGARGSDGDTTYANAGRRGRVYFHMDEAAPLHVRLRLRPQGTRALTPYFNNNQIQSVFFEGDGWQNVDFQVPADHVKAGENYLLLSFGGVTLIGGEDVSVELASMHVSKSAPAGDYVAPEWGTTVATVELGGTQRSALTFDTPVAFRWYAEVPRDGKLSVALGQEGQAGGAAKIVVTPEGGQAATLFEGPLTAEWNEQSLDLSRFAGNVVEVELSATGGSGRAVFGEPSITRPATDAPEIEHAKNVVVVLVDTLRASKLKPYNPQSRVRTPVFDELAEQSAFFERGQSTENWTKPAVGAILTGLHPMDHGARTQSAVLSNDALMLSEHFKANGFATGGFIANGYISDRYGFDQGWDRYRNFIREEGSSEAENVFKEAGDWAMEHKDERFFLYVHTIDPHVPYDPEDEFVSMYDSRSNYQGQVQPRQTGPLLAEAKKNPPTVTFTPSDVIRLQALHDGEITQHDRHMGTFINRFKEAGIWEDTVFVFVADHGEEFNEHGSWGHGHSIYQELLHVPFMIHHEGNIPARRISTQVSTLEIAPTVLELADVDPMPGTAGESLVPLMWGQERSGPAVAMSEFLDERRVVVAGRWKFIVRGNLTVSMFDLQSDPGEENQLDLGEHPIAARYLRTMQGQFLGATDRSDWLNSEQGRGIRHGAGEVQMDAELQAQLRELGYVN